MLGSAYYNVICTSGSTRDFLVCYFYVSQSHFRRSLGSLHPGLLPRFVKPMQYVVNFLFSPSFVRDLFGMLF